MRPRRLKVDWYALRWHLLLWDPWFLVWGLLLGAAALEYGGGGYSGAPQLHHRAA